MATIKPVKPGTTAPATDDKPPATTRFGISFRQIKGALAVTAAAAVVVITAQPASAGAIVEHTNPTDNPGACYFEPGDVPGVNAYYDATCTFVHLPSGGLQVVAKGQLPEGYTLTETFQGELKSCFGGTGRIVATTSGQVQATCRLSG